FSARSSGDGGIGTGRPSPHQATAIAAAASVNKLTALRIRFPANRSALAVATRPAKMLQSKARPPAPLDKREDSSHPVACRSDVAILTHSLSRHVGFSIVILHPARLCSLQSRFCPQSQAQSPWGRPLWVRPSCAQPLQARPLW